MSASMVRKSLAIVDGDFGSCKGDKKKGKKKVIGNLIPDNHKLFKKVGQKGRKGKVEILRTQAKTTVTEARKTCKLKGQILKENLDKLKLIQQASAIDLDEEVTRQIIERAVTKRPVHIKKKSKEAKETAFTEEDFAKFEAEYFDE